MPRLPGRRSAPSPQIVAKVLFGLFEAEHANRSQRDRVHMVLLDGEVRKIAGSFHITTIPARTDGRPNRPLSEPGPTTLARLVGRANDRFESQRERLRMVWDGTAKGFAKSCRLKLFDAFDREYYALTKGGRFDRLDAGFIRRHAEDFFTDRWRTVRRHAARSVRRAVAGGLRAVRRPENIRSRTSC